MARFNDGDKVRLKKDYYKNWWFGGLSRDKRKKISEKENRVARVTTNDMSDICQEYPNGIIEIRFNDRTFYMVHEDMLELVATKVKLSEPKHTVWTDELGNITNEMWEFCRTMLNYPETSPNEVFRKMENNLIKGITPISIKENKHSYTAEQIADAKQIVSDILLNACRRGWQVSYGFHNNEDVIWARYVIPEKHPMGEYHVAKCSETDEYNPYIGIMIALCRANGRKVPDWVYGNE